MNCERSPWENEETEASGAEEILANIALLQIPEAESNWLQPCSNLDPQAAAR